MSDAQRGESVLFEISLSVGGEPVQGSARVPNRPVRMTEMLPLFAGIEDAVVAAVVRRVEADGAPVSCRPGCGACCRQLVPLSEPEARHIAALVDGLPEERRAVIRARFASALERLERAGVLEMLRKPPAELRSHESRVRLHEAYFGLRIACPFLENESCGIYPERPLTCREYLVTSPAANCGNPTPASIQMVSMPVKFSTVLYHFGDGAGSEPARWVPLILALEWTAANPEEPAWRGPELFGNFLKRVKEAAGR